MSSARFNTWWPRREDKSVKNRSRRRPGQTRLTSVESLEPRALLAVTGLYYDDFGSFNDPTSTAWINQNVAAGAPTVTSLANSGGGVLVLTIDGTGGNGDDLYLRVDGNRYVFATDVNFTNVLPLSTNAYAAPSTPPVAGFPGAGSINLGSTGIRGDFQHQFVLQTTDPNTTTTPTTPGAVGTFFSGFHTIYVRTSGLTDGVDTPTFTIVGGSQDIAKTLVVDLSDNAGNPISGSAISIGSPVVVPTQSPNAGALGAFGGRIYTGTGANIAVPVNVTGGVYLNSESIAVNAKVSSVNGLSLLSEIGDANRTDGVVPTGIAVNYNVSLPNNANIQAFGTGLRVNAGGSIQATGANSNLSLQLQDADAIIAGTINFAQQSYFMLPSAGDPLLATEHTITTRSASTGLQTGLISGNTLVTYLSGKAGPTAARDGSVDIQTSLSTLRLTPATTEAEMLDYQIKVSNNKTLTLDTVMASEGDINIAATVGTVNLDAVVDTIGSFSLSSAAALTVNSPITSASTVTLTSNGTDPITPTNTNDVTTNAAIYTREAATSKGEVRITAKEGSVNINSLVKAEFDGVVITAKNKILGAATGGAAVTGQISGTSATLTAGTGIGDAVVGGKNVGIGTDVSALTAVSTSGNIVIIDSRNDGTQLVVNSVLAKSGSISLTAAQNIDLLSVEARGTGNISATSTGGNIDVRTVVADGNTVTLTAAKFSNDLTVDDWLAGNASVVSAGYISGLAPTANEIVWNAANVVNNTTDDLTDNTDLYRNIPIVSARRLSSGDIAFIADNAVTLRSVVTSDGSVTVGSTNGSITAESVISKQGATIAASNVTLVADGQVVLGSATAADGFVMATNGFVDVTAGQSIAMATSADATTPAFVSGTVMLRAAAGGGPGSIGTATQRVTVESPTMGGEVGLTVERADDPILYPNAIEPESVYLGATSAVALNAVAVNLVDVLTTGAISDINVQSVQVSDTAGQAVLSAGRNLLVGTVQVGDGAFADGSKITLVAGKAIQNVDPTDPFQTVIDADALSLQAASFDGTFNVSNIDSVNRLSATATGNGGVVNLAFNRARAITLDGITTANGSVSISNVRAAATVTADSYTGATQDFTSTSPDFADGDEFYFADGSSLPDGFSAQATYFIVNSVPGMSFQLALTPGGTAVGGATDAAGPIDLVSNGSLLIGAGGITAGTATSKNTVVLTTKGEIGVPTDPTEAQGTIFAASAVTLNAESDIDALTKAGQLAARSTTGVIDITQTGNVTLGDIKTDAANSTVNLAVTGTITTGTGTITTDTATVTATTGMTLKTDVVTLSAESTNGNITVTEANGLDVGAGGIRAPNGTASITLTRGSLQGAGQPIQASGLVIKLLENNNAIDVQASAGTIAASTALGDISITNDRSFSIGSTGIVAGNGVSDVILEATSGAITSSGTSGTVKGDSLTVTAASGIGLKTSVTTVESATSTSGDISIAQTGKAVTLTSVAASNGSVTVSNNDNIAVGSVQAVGSGRNVTMTATGVNKSIAMAANSIVAEGDTVSLSATGGIDGTSKNTDPDVTAQSVVLQASGDVTATLKTSRVTASALGVDPTTHTASNLDITVLGSAAKPLLLSSGTNGTTLKAAGNVSLTTLDSQDPDGTGPLGAGVDIVVVTKPTAGGTLELNTHGLVTFAITSTAGSGTGSLTQALTDAATVTNNLVPNEGTGVAFSSTLNSPLVLTKTVNLANPITIDGTNRINVATGTYVQGRMIDVDGSRLTTDTSGFNLAETADGSTIRGMAFYGFTKAGGAAITLAGNAGDPLDSVTIAGNSFGMTSAARPVSNLVGISATYATGLTISGNTVGKSTDAGIRLGAGVSNAHVYGNLIGTNAARTNFGNAIGIDVTGAGTGNEFGTYLNDKGETVVSANIVSFNTTAGIRVTDTDASAGAATLIRGNEVLLNGTGVKPSPGAGILVNGASQNVVLVGNTVTRNLGDGITINGTSQDVTVGGATAADRNFIGTNATTSLGLGNARNGVVVSSAGTGISVINNVVLGNGTKNVVGDNAGVKLSGTDASLTVTKNTINANRGPGLFAVVGARGTVTANTITSNLASGVLVDDGANVVIGSAASETDDAKIRLNANTINSNARFGVEVLTAAFAQIVGNSMASNTSGGISNAGFSSLPTITSATYSKSGTLTVAISNLAAGQVVNVYTGTAQGRTYLGQVTVAANQTTATFTMTRSQQTVAGVAAQVYAGALITATRSTTGANGQTSPFAKAYSAKSVA